MSIRTVAQRIVQNGKIILRSLRNNEHCSAYAKGQLDKIHVVQVGKPLGQLPQGGGSSTVAASSTHLGYIGAQARRLFVDNILKRVTNSLAADLRRRAARRLLYGDSAPFFALVGVSLASGTGLLTKEDELEGVCWEIREAVSKIQWTKPQNDRNHESIAITEDSPSLKNFIIGPPIAKGCSAVVYAAKFKDEGEETITNEPVIDRTTTDPTSFPFALKMMFNYDAESNALTILKAMYRETVPARKYHANDEVAIWEQRMAENKRTLPPHPNIVAMYYVFADRVPLLPGARMYPDALPARLNPEGSGRNMSLFLLMKRYDTTVKQYLRNKVENGEIDVRESVLLLAQLLEGIAHMNAHGIAHRDLKSDNILLDTLEDPANCPSLVITDFGCCLADKHHGLYLPYNSHDVDRGGNSTLMAPEVINAEPGPFTSINFTKADLWTAGAIAYELFGAKNPFYGAKGQKAILQNFSYNDEQLPDLPQGVPPIVTALIKNMLSKSIYKRLSVEVAATIMQLYLWAPSSWLRRNSKMPSSSEIIQWLVCLTTKVLCEGREINLPSPERGSPVAENNKPDFKNYRRMLSTRSCGRRTMPEYQLIASFLARVNLSTVRDSFRWIHRNASHMVV